MSDSGPVNVCKEHAQQLVSPGACIGVHVAVTKLEEPAQCSNCASEGDNHGR